MQFHIQCTVQREMLARRTRLETTCQSRRGTPSDNRLHVFALVVTYATTYNV